MEPKWSVRPYSEGDEEGILELWKAVYPEREYDREKWLRWWRQMYKDNPAGAGWTWLAEHNGKIVGQYTIIPVVRKIADETITCALSLDTMTHPDYRRQGIFETLTRKTYAQAAQESVHIVYGFPNKFSYPGFIKKLNWFDISSLQTMIKPLDWANVIKLKVKNRFLQRVLAIGGKVAFSKVFFRTQKPPTVEGLIINQVTSFDDRFDKFWARVSSQHQIMVVRDKDYLNWRYTAPETNYSIFAAEKFDEISGYLILRQKKQGDVKEGFIFDMMAQSPEVMHCLLSKAIEHCKQNKIALILYSLLADKTYHRVLKRNGFLSLPIMKGAPFCAYSRSPSIPKEFLENPENWFVQIGDSDAI